MHNQEATRRYQRSLALGRCRGANVVSLKAAAFHALLGNTDGADGESRFVSLWKSAGDTSRHKAAERVFVSHRTPRLPKVRACHPGQWGKIAHVDFVVRLSMNRRTATAPSVRRCSPSRRRCIGRIRGGPEGLPHGVRPLSYWKGDPCRFPAGGSPPGLLRLRRKLRAF